MPITYSKKMMIERIQRHMNNGFPDTDFKTSANEILLYIDQALAFQTVGKVYEGAKVEGSLVVPEAVYLTSQLAALTQNQATSEWETTLPQPPLSLPLGYSISDLYFADGVYGKSQPVFPIRAKRTGYRNFMPYPAGFFYKVEGSKLKVFSDSGVPTTGLNLYVTMISSRTNDVNEAMNVPDDMLEGIFNDVVGQLTKRMGIPMDIVKDNLPQGNKSS